MHDRKANAEAPPSLLPKRPGSIKQGEASEQGVFWAMSECCSVDVLEFADISLLFSVKQL